MESNHDEVYAEPHSLLTEAVIDAQSPIRENEESDRVSIIESEVARQTPCLIRSVSPFAKLPHPASHFYSLLRTTDGSDYQSLIYFISVALKIKSLAGITDNLLLQSLFTYSRGLLADKVSRAI